MLNGDHCGLTIAVLIFHSFINDALDLGAKSTASSGKN
jgi:hypothetical protein